ncbi:MAG: TetR/AcrR family transcriptional regulator [Solirubrobacteraceae bacterium]|nr:TetR/AcrR family transcriptional regulator [Solirubrobacteraceae bacterium]
MAGRRSDEHARATRARILRESLELASHVGFDGITIGGLAKQLDMSKAGVLGHFASKEELQLAVHAEAAATFKREVVDRGREHPPGIQRLLAFCSLWADFIESPPWSGGCILTAASFEFDAQPGPVAARTREGMVSWRSAIQRQAQIAIDDGDLPREHDAAQVAFVIVAMVTGTIQAIQTHRDPTACDRLRTALAVQFGRPIATA